MVAQVVSTHQAPSIGGPGWSPRGTRVSAYIFKTGSEFRSFTNLEDLLLFDSRLLLPAAVGQRCASPRLII